MALLAIKTIFSGKLVQALCWMLLHSIWIGLLVSVAAGIIIQATKHRTATLRYNLLFSVFLAFILAIMGIFILHLTGATMELNERAVDVTPTTIGNLNVDLSTANMALAEKGFKASLTGFFDEHATIIVCTWLIIIAFRGLQMAVGLQKINKLRIAQLSPVSDDWNKKFHRLANALRIRQKVRLLQSGIAKIPMVTGHFKPIILLPIGLINSLPTGEVEAILLHELAHIHRKDYLVNILQHIVEIIFFFNPAILWISALIKTEREHCCDDIALARTSSKRDYINALVSFQEYHLSSPKYASAFAVNKRQLLLRVKRMLYNNNKTLNNMEKTFLTLCLVAAASLTVLITQTSTAQKNNGTNVIAVNDTIPDFINRAYNPRDFEEGSSYSFTEKKNGVSYTLYVFKRNGILYEIFGDITSFKINGETVPQSELGKYKNLISQLRLDYAANHETTYTEVAENEITTAGNAAIAAQRDKLRAEQAHLAKLDKEENQHLAELDKLKAEQHRLELLQIRKDAEQKNFKIDAETRKKQQETNKKKAEADQQKALNDSKRQTSQYKREISYRSDDGKNVTTSNLSYYEGYDRVKPAAPVYGNTNSYGKKGYKTGIQRDGTGNTGEVDIKELNNNIIIDLIDAKVINSAENLSYKVSNDFLIVNGQKQPETLHHKLKEKYIKTPDWVLFYNWSN